MFGIIPGMPPTVLLFDIDGTLIDTGGAGRRAMERAFERYVGKRDACASIPFAGMTDRAIARGGLTAAKREAEEGAIDAVLALYLEALAEEVTSSLNCRVHVGVEAALTSAEATHGVAIGLGTGNIRDGARLKLERVGIHHRFTFGGYGCDHEDRAEILRAGAVRGAASLGAPLSECRVVVIGDTPKDIAAAHAIAAESIAVCTGSFGAGDLAVRRPTHVFRDLSDAGALAALLGEQPRTSP
jgi:phosphoglycolate phosphatase-like HAD superfamily hydrolase